MLIYRLSCALSGDNSVLIDSQYIPFTWLCSHVGNQFASRNGIVILWTSACVQIFFVYDLQMFVTSALWIAIAVVSSFCEKKKLLLKSKLRTFYHICNSEKLCTSVYMHTGHVGQEKVSACCWCFIHREGVFHVDYLLLEDLWGPTKPTVFLPVHRSLSSAIPFLSPAVFHPPVLRNGDVRPLQRNYQGCKAISHLCVHPIHLLER